MTWLIHVANLLILGSYLVRDMLALRAIAVLASLSFLAYFAFGPTPNPAAAGWNILFSVVNLAQGALLLHERRNARLSPEEHEIWQRAFAHLEPARAAKLLRLCSRRQGKPNEFLLRQGEDVQRLTLLWRGEAIVDVRGMTVGRCDDGDFLGEMAMTGDGKASATVQILGNAELIQWELPALRKLLEQEPILSAGLHTAFAANMSAKLRRKSQDSLLLAELPTTMLGVL